MFKTRLVYLLMCSFESTAEQWRKDPEGLKVEINAHLKRASEYRSELKQKDLMSYEIDELVYNFVFPADIPSRGVPDQVVYEQIMDWGTGVS